MGELTMEHMKIGYIYGLLEDYQDKPWIFSVECDVDSQHYIYSFAVTTGIRTSIETTESIDDILEVITQTVNKEGKNYE